MRLSLNVVRWLNARHGLGPSGRDDVRMDDYTTYPSGLRLTGRRVVVVGGGHVAQRRVPHLIAAGADVHVVSPAVTPAIEGMVGSGEVTWHERGFADGDLDEAWYVVAATDDEADTSQRRTDVRRDRVGDRRDDVTRAVQHQGRLPGCDRRTELIGHRKRERAAVVVPVAADDAAVHRTGGASLDRRVPVVDGGRSGQRQAGEHYRVRVVGERRGQCRPGVAADDDLRHVQCR